MTRRHRHTWTKWKIVRVQLTNGAGVADAQERECTECCYVERERL